jgi:hypothetical protein
LLILNKIPIKGGLNIMSDYDMTFAKKILSDEDFDTIFGAEEDDRLMKALKESDDFVKDDPDTDGVEDGYGDLGKGSGLGSDIGPDHDGNGVSKAQDDTSDNDIMVKAAGNTLDKGDQLNVGDNAQGGKIDDGDQSTGDFHVAGDNADAADKTFEQAFEEAYAALMEEIGPDLGPDDLGVEPDGGVEQPPVEAPVQPDVYPNATGNYTDLLDSDPEMDTYPDNTVDNSVIDDCGASCNKPAGCPQPPIKEEGDVAREERDSCGVEDCKGSENLGDELGPDHDGNGVSKPSNDTSDEDILAALGGDTFSKGDQLNVNDRASGKVDDGDQVSGDLHVAGDDDSSASDSFKEAAEDEELGSGEETEEVEDDMIDAANSSSEEGDASDDVVNSLIADEDGDEDLIDLL